VASLSRSRQSDDPDLIEARRRLRTERCAAYIEKVLAELLDSVAALGMSQAPLSLLALLVSKRT